MEGGGVGGPHAGVWEALACVWEALACVWEALAQHMCKYVCWRHWRVRGKAGDGAAPACPGPGWPGRVVFVCVCARARERARARMCVRAPRAWCARACVRQRPPGLAVSERLTTANWSNHDAAF